MSDIENIGIEHIHPHPENHFISWLKVPMTCLRKGDACENKLKTAALKGML